MDVATRNNVTRVGDPSGPTLLLAHGFGCDQQLWHPAAAMIGALAVSTAPERFAKLVMVTPSPALALGVPR
jgi:pimeloyl-ACP methyl ester carboxylesterase